MAKLIDLNADIGEGYDDASILPFVSSCNIACGGHIGDRDTIKATMALAITQGVAVGAHPSYPDKEGFGRRKLSISEGDLETALIEQLRLFKDVADEQGITPSHVKPHGALYNEAVKSAEHARAVVSAVKRVLPSTTLVGAPFGELRGVALAQGVPYRAEGFVDRQYLDDGTLMPRTQDGAVIKDPERQADQALCLANGEGATGPNGDPVALVVETLCLHGDTVGAAESARRIHKALTQNGFAIEAKP